MLYLKKTVYLFLIVFLSSPVLYAGGKPIVHPESQDSILSGGTQVDKIIKQLSKFRISSYIHGQYQYGQKDAKLDVGSSNENPDKGFNRFGVRRGRLKVEYNDGIGTGAIQIDVSDDGLSFRDLYIGVKDPWTKRSELKAGFFICPFGHEITYSTSRLESVEMATVTRNFIPDSRDLGIMLSLRTKESSPLNFLLLEGGFFAGNGIHQDTDSRKDFIGRLRGDKAIGNWGKWGLGFSYYNGHVFNPTRSYYIMEGDRFVSKEKDNTGSYMKREYFGLDGQFAFDNVLGKTTVRAEGIIGTQPGTVNSSVSPNSGSRPENEPENALYKRPFLGYIFYLIQDVGHTPLSMVLKYDMYDPNTKVSGDEIGMSDYTSKTDLQQSTVGVGALYHFNKHIRLQAWYAFNFNEKTEYISGYDSNRKDNVFTLRLQYKF